MPAVLWAIWPSTADTRPFGSDTEAADGRPIPRSPLVYDRLLTCGNARQDALLGLALRPRNVPGFEKRRPKHYLGQAPDLAVLDYAHTPRGRGMRGLLRELRRWAAFWVFGG